MGNNISVLTIVAAKGPTLRIKRKVMEPSFGVIKDNIRATGKMISIMERAYCWIETETKSRLNGRKERESKRIMLFHSEINKLKSLFLREDTHKHY
jgi:hypothetical protein